jgi:hypothetical protein
MGKFSFWFSSYLFDSLLGNFVTNTNHSLGTACLEKVQWEATQQGKNRLTFFGNELSATRAGYEDYLLSKTQIAQSWKNGLLGKEAAGLGFAALLFVGFFASGTVIGRRSLEAWHGM